jgi:cbb3-type cytochrome oxidase maturation protein
MNIVLVMLGLSLILLLGAVAFFFWAVDHDQFDDLEAPALLALDDHPVRAPAESDESRRWPAR